MASVREKILQTRNRSRSHVGYILILLASAFHSPRVIDFRETSARGKRAANGWKFTAAVRCRAFYFRPWDKIEDPVCIPRSFYRDWMPRLTSRRSFRDAPRSPRRDRGEPHRSLLRSLPRHVRAPIQLKRRKQTRTLEERC